MAKYHFKIIKADHPNIDGSWDLHVHIYFGEIGRPALLGRYRLPTLEPIFRTRELNQTEIIILGEWLSKEPQLKKLQNCLKDTLFDLHKIAKEIPAFGNIIKEGGETFIAIKIPVSRRLK